MKGKPIIFSGEMVRAILDGRKTKTRRVIKPQPDEDGLVRDLGKSSDAWFDTSEREYKCPYGGHGDRLWVRETWRRSFSQFGQLPDGIEFKANNLLVYFDKSDRGVQAKNAATEKSLPRDGRWRPSIYMPRWASRITLEITDVRVERIQEITAKDCIQEGCPNRLVGTPIKSDKIAVRGFQLLWNSINAKRGYGWDVNPWVWVVEFAHNPPPGEKRIK
jgi:hypothetical protein